MRHRTGWLALAATGRWADAPARHPQGAAAPGARPVADRPAVVDCSTTYLVIATVSHCGSAGLKLGVAGE